MYPWAGYGQRFILRLCSENPTPYGSCGNGSAVQISFVAWLFDDLNTVALPAALLPSRCKTIIVLIGGRT
jgi:hypothetical protein